jgi:Glycosyltransferase family 87
VIRHAVGRTVIAAAVLIAIMGYLFVGLRVAPSVFARSKNDFACFYRAGRMVVAGEGFRVYELPAEREYDDALGTKTVGADGKSVSLPFVFAPFTLLLFAPLAELPYRQADFAWYTLNAAILLALPFLLRKRLDLGPAAVVFALIAPFFFLPAILALIQGQPAILTLLLFALAYVDLGSGQELRAGCWLALASFKPQFVLPMLLALIVWRKKTMLLAFALTCAGLIVVSVPLVGWQATFGYPRALMRYASMAGQPGGEHPASMPNLRGFLYSALDARVTPALLQLATLSISLMLMTGMAFLLKRQKQVSPEGFSLVLIVTLLISYHSYLHDDSLLLLPCLILAREMLRSHKPGFQILASSTIAVVFIVPLAPTSLTMTASQMFVAILAFSTPMSVRVFTKDKTEPAPEEMKGLRLPVTCGSPFSQ